METEKTDRVSYDRIIHYARSRFLASGFRSVRMDDVARELRVSKKTLYRLFGTKEELVRRAVFAHLQRVDAELTEVFEDRNSTFVPRLHRFLHIVSGVLRTISSSFVWDMNRYAPELWDEIEEFRRKRVFSRLEGLLQEGAAAGIVSREVQPHVVVQIFIAIADSVMTPPRLVEMDLTPSSVLHTVTTLLSDGILTEQGRSEMRKTKDGTADEDQKRGAG